MQAGGCWLVIACWCWLVGWLMLACCWCGAGGGWQTGLDGLGRTPREPREGSRGLQGWGCWLATAALSLRAYCCTGQAGGCKRAPGEPWEGPGRALGGLRDGAGGTSRWLREPWGDLGRVPGDHGDLSLCFTVFGGLGCSELTFTYTRASEAPRHWKT